MKVEGLELFWTEIWGENEEIKKGGGGGYMKYNREIWKLIVH